MKKNKKYIIIHLIILFIISFIISFSCYMFYRFSTTSFEQIIFTIFNLDGFTGGGVTLPTLKYCVPFSLLIFIFLYILFYDITFNKKKLIIKKKQIYPFVFINKHKKIITLILFCLSVLLLLRSVNFFSYLSYSRITSTFIEDNYVDPKNVEISFEEKRNLIIIYVESLETSLLKKDKGGYWNYDVTPELYELLNDDDSVVFYNENKLKELSMIEGTSWTTAALVANNTALPFKVSIDGSSYHAKNFMNGSYALGDILYDNGYYNELISASTTSFGGINEFFKRHGKYKIVDNNSLKKYGFKTTKDDLGNWGINDNYLFKIAKERLDKISKKDKPFNLNLVTIDTHFIDGFVGKYSENKFDEQYENAYATTSRLIYDFVNWVKTKDYYDNTTILIMGDHLSMQNDFFDKRNAKDRYVYSCIINPRSKDGNFENRIYTSLDTYPTILYSIGANIKGDKLGLGVNLFSDKKTLAEEYGVKELDYKLQVRSKFYNDVLLDDDYLLVK